MNKSIKRTVLLSAILLEFGGGVHAASIPVDGMTCSLNDAIEAANTDAVVGGCHSGDGIDVLELTSGLTVTLINELTSINSKITIEGNGSTIERDVNSSAFGIITVESGGELTLNDITLSNGDTGGVNNTGGGINVTDGHLELNRSVVTDNQGGGIVITNSTGIISESVIKNNYGFDVSEYLGAGVTINCSDFTITRSTIRDNESNTFPGGAGVIFTGDCGVTLDINNSTISGNISHDWAGGILADTGGSAMLNLTHVTIANNLCAYTAEYAFGSAMSINRTITNIKQSLISGNTCVNSSGYIAAVNAFTATAFADSHNIFGFNSISGLHGVTLGETDIVPTELNLSDVINPELRDNGGLTPTHALNLIGPAIDVIPEIECASPIDQTGLARPVDFFASGIANCDIGAVEAHSDIIFKNGFD